MKTASKRLIWLITAFTLLPSCSRKVYVPVKETEIHLVHDTLRLSTLRKDSVALTDSVVIERRGDTLHHTAWRTRFRLRENTDTVRIAIHDTLRLREPVIHTVQEPRRNYFSRLWPALLLTALFLLLRRKE